MADRDRVTIEIGEMLAKAQPLFTTECCIYRVPHLIRQLNQEAYTPEVVSIGPLHHGNTKLLKMEGHKKVYCQHFIERSEASLDSLVSCVRELEPWVRSCYSENIELGVDELVKVILVDCGFIIELFLRGSNSTRDDVIFSRPWLFSLIEYDLLLLENQLPFFVFEKLYNLAFASLSDDDEYPPFLQLAVRFFCYVNQQRLSPPSASSIAHFTDLLRTFHLPPSDQRPSRKGKPLTLRYSASELNEGGVKFTVNETSHSMLDFQFSGHILKIPHISVYSTTEILFRNMVALEQCHYPSDSYITDYVILLDYLINTDKDVDVLVKHGIILHVLSDNNKVAELFNGLARNVVETNSSTDYRRICKELSAYYEHPWHAKKATLKHDYCNTPWKTVASIAGIALLILTVIQSVCSILQVV